MYKVFNEDMKEIEMDILTYQLNIFPLDNFSSYGLLMDGKYFQTSEHAFQYLKFVNTNKEIAEKIKNAYSPDEARLIAHANKKYKPNNWDSVKYENMEKVLKLKVSQNENVLNKLLDTKNNFIAEFCIDQDTDWGIDENNKGNNNLGKIWMKIRDELNKQMSK